MAKKKNEETENVPAVDGGRETVTVPQGVTVPDVFDLDELWKMKFVDPKTGEISMVRKAFKPRGKLELYNPDL